MRNTMNFRKTLLVTAISATFASGSAFADTTMPITVDNNRFNQITESMDSDVRIEAGTSDKGKEVVRLVYTDENGDDKAIATALDNCTKKIGITWVVDTSKIKQISA